MYIHTYIHTYIYTYINICIIFFMWMVYIFTDDILLISASIWLLQFKLNIWEGFELNFI